MRRTQPHGLNSLAPRTRAHKTWPPLHLPLTALTHELRSSKLPRIIERTWRVPGRYKAPHHMRHALLLPAQEPAQPLPIHSAEPAEFLMRHTEFGQGQLELLRREFLIIFP